MVPDKPQWTHRIPEILQELCAIEAPFVDRSVIEQVFRLRRRSAIYLMENLGGYQVGKTFLVNRKELIQKIQRLSAGEVYEREVRRRARISDELETARKTLAARNIRITAAPDALDQTVEGLPPAIRLQPGKLEIEFDGVEDLLRSLLELAMAIQNDYVRFQGIAEGS